MYNDSNERRAFQRRKESLFRKGYEFQKKFQARVYIVIERHGVYYVYRHSQRASNWPPYHEATEIRTAKTVFPSDFQTVRDADTRGPVSSDAEETTSLRTLSHEGPVPSRSVDDDDAYRDAEGKMAQYRAPSYDHPDPGQPAYLDNPESFAVPTGERDTPIWGIDVMEDGAGGYKYNGDGRGVMQGFEASSRQQPSDRQSPTGNFPAPAETDAGRTTQAGLAHGLREGRPQEPAAVKRLFTRNIGQAHGERGSLQDPLEKPLDANDIGAMELDHASGLDEATWRASLRHVSMGDPSSKNGPTAERKAHVFDERALLQHPSRGRSFENSGGEMAGSGGLERQRRTLTGRGSTTDQSPQRFTSGRGRPAHSIASSPSRRPPSQSLNHLPRVPSRGLYKS